MTLNTNIAPYFNDFEETRNFHQILFNPSLAVQARELTQLQNILQTQTKRFGDSVFKDGAVVTGGSQFVERVVYIKIQSTTIQDVTSVIGKYVITSNNSVYRIKDVTPATTTDPITLFCIAVSNTGGALVKVDSGETISIKTNYTESTIDGTMVVVSQNHTGISIFFNIDSGVFYTNGFFVRQQSASICLDKYNPTPTKLVGFDVVEKIVTVNDVELGGDSLFDPAQGTSNYAAPGADRYHISLKLRVVDIDDVSMPISTTSKFIELNRIVDGQVSRQIYANQYSYLGDTLARRTYEESGDYVVNNFKFHLENSPMGDFVDGVVQSGKAYIRGYEVETLVPQRISIPKARTTQSVTGYDIPVYYGNYLIVTGLVGGTTASMFGVSTMELVSLYADTTPTSTNKVGTARVKSLEWVSGSGTSAIFKLFLTDVIGTGNLLSVKSVANLAYNTYTIKGNVDATGMTSIIGNTSFASGVSSIIVSTPSTVRVGMLVSGTGIQANTVVTSVVASTVGLSLTTNATSSGTVTFSGTNFVESNYDNAIFRIPHSNVESIDNIEYAVRRNIDVAVSTGTGTQSISVSGERFKDASTTTNMNRHYVAIVKSKTAGVLAVGTILALSTTSNPKITLDVNSTTLTLNTGDATFNGIVQLVATIDIQNAPKKTKSLSVSPKQKTLGAGLWVSGTQYSLGYADVDSIIGVYEAPDLITTPTTSHTNITSRFSLNKNFKDAFYDHSIITLKDGETIPTNGILIQFNVLEHSSGHGYFGSDSYPVYDNIPTYTDNLGKVYNLTDCIDFRPKRTDDASASLSVYSASNIALVGQQNIDTIYNFGNADYNFYLGRIDKVVMGKDGRLVVVSGVPALVSPQEPNDVDTGMTLAVLRIPPYTKTKDEIVTTLVKNRRYTMKDVGKIDDRVARLEYYSTLNELEKEIVNTTFTNASNEVMFNSGFIVDTFRGHGIGNVNHPDYKCSIDFSSKTLRPSFKANAAQWIMNGGLNNLGYTGKKKFAMLPLNSTTPEVPLITQNIASKTVSVNPFNVQSFVGTLRLLPDRDIWINNTNLPEIITNEANDGAAVQAGITGTTWGEWALVSTNYSGDNTIKTFARTGEETFIEEKVVTRSSSTDIVSTTFNYRMRDQDIEFVVDGLRPNTNFAVWFDGVNITMTSCKQYNPTTQTYDISELKTDSSGSARGIMKIRDTMFTTFYSGKKLVQVSDGWWNPVVSTTYAEATFYSEGRETVSQTSKVMGIDYVTSKRNVTENKTETIYSPPVTNPTTPGTGGGAPATYYGSTVLNAPQVSSVFVNAAGVAFNSGGTATNEDYVALLTQDHASYHSGNPSLQATAEPLGSLANNTVQAVVNGQTGLTPAASYNSVNASLMAQAISTGTVSVGDRPLTPQEAVFLITAAGQASNTFAEVLAQAQSAAASLPPGVSYLGGDANGNPILCSGVSDPTAQTFFITNDNPDGVFISSVDTFFSHKDLTGAAPIILELRPTVNGYPDSYRVIPGQVIVKQASEIVLPVNGNVPMPTVWTFENPIHLFPGEYSLVLKSDSSDYRVYVAEIGAKKLGTDEVIATQPTLGSYFASQNATTWTPDQNLDLMFNIRRASFQTGVSLVSVFDLERAKTNYGVELDALMDVFNLNTAYGFYEGKTSVKFEVSTKDLTDTQRDYIEIIPGNDIFPGYRSKHYATGDTKLRVTMVSNDEKLSPYAEIFPSGFVMVENIINNGDVGFPDTLPTGTGSSAVYITKPYVLEEGFDASSVRIIMLENVPTGQTIEVYMKGLNNNDSSNIETLNWIPVPRKTPPRNPATFYDYYDTEYVLDDFTYGDYTTFRAVMFKVVLKSADPSRAPSVKKFRAISLA